MRALVIALGLLLTPVAAADDFVVIGDSLSAFREAWTVQLQRRGHHVKIHAQNNRTAMEYVPPRDLKLAQGERLIYLLGTNDAQHSEKATDRFGYHLTAHIMGFLAQGIRPVLIIPPAFPFIPRMAAIRSTIHGHCNFWNLECIDLEQMFDFSLTYDGVHPLPELHVHIADHIEERLAEMQ
jgi:hypothetical protein